jgi:hypothetical protein
MITLARLTIIAALAGAIALIAGILVARADTPAEAYCKEKLGTDGDYHGGKSDAEYAQQAADWTRCMKEYTGKPATFHPWQEIWQCNDIRVTVTMRDPNVIEYDLGGTIWGGSQFAKPLNGPLYFNGRPCLPLR